MQRIVILLGGLMAGSLLAVSLSVVASPNPIMVGPTAPSGVAAGDIDLSTGGYQLIFDGGTAQNPGLSLGDDDDGSGTGFYSVSPNNLRLAVNGQERVQFQQSVVVFNYEVLGYQGITPGVVTADPCGGSGYRKSSLFFNDTGKFWCGCDGTNDVKISDGTACF